MKVFAMILYTAFHAKFSCDVLGFVQNSAHNDLSLAMFVYGLFLITGYILVIWLILRQK
jgi:hypothetical protein